MIYFIKKYNIMSTEPKTRKNCESGPSFFLSNKILKRWLTLSMLQVPVMDVGMHTEIESHLNSSTYSNWEYE